MSAPPTNDPTAPSARRAALGARLLTFGWAACITAVVVSLHSYTPRGLAEVLLGSELFHVVAHLFLYGTMAASALVWTQRRAVVLGVVLLAGFVQEAAQTLLYGSPMGGPELFDLGVDTAAVLLVFAGHALITHRKAQRRAAEAGGTE